MRTIYAEYNINHDNKAGGACVTVKINCNESWLKIDILLLL